jgi:hypothetical protein
LIIPKNVEYPRHDMDEFMASSFEDFLSKTPEYITIDYDINKCHTNCIEQTKLFKNQYRIPIDVDGYNTYKKIVKDLNNMAKEAKHAENDYRYNTRLFYDYVLGNFNCVKSCIDYIIDLKGVEISCSVRLALLEKELPESIYILQNLQYTNHKFL